MRQVVAVDESRVDGYQGEFWGLRGDEFPDCLVAEDLGGVVESEGCLCVVGSCEITFCVDD
ncbi:MAG: hypothetical protein CL912_18535 [Deltaproteobacteria bacterium]|nr:hypothetical protein [Deltaproteobacteria bacterium]